jgi:hypothetical protein
LLCILIANSSFFDDKKGIPKGCLFLFMQRLLIFILIFSLFSCQETEDPTHAEADATIIITSTLNLIPSEIFVPSGGRISIINEDSNPHTITSQSAADAFDNSGTFDVLVPSGGVANLTIPESPSGTVYHFYCRFYLGALSPSGGSITIE